MSLLTFLFHRNKTKSLLASQKYGDKQINPEELDKPLLAHKFPTYEEREKSRKLGKISILKRKECPKIFTEAEENEKEV